MALSLRNFENPPVEYRPWTRWWWPGGAVEQTELLREVHLFAEHGFGGAEIQAFTAGIDPQTTRDPASAVNDYGSMAFYEKLVAVIEEARRVGIQIDLTVGSGWPAGGDFIPLEDNVDTLLYGETTVTRAVNMPVPPPIMPFAYAIYSPNSILPLLVGREWTQTLHYHPEQAHLVAVVAARIVDNRRSSDPSVLTDTLTLAPESALDITAHVQDGHLAWEPPASGDWQVIAIYSMPSGSKTLISAGTGKGYAVDPFDSAAIERFYDQWLGTHPEILQFAGTTLRHLFGDSYEYFPQRHFADEFIDLFRTSRGYDITPYLPAVFQPARDQHFWFFSGLGTAPDFSFGALSERIIYDYDLTISDLFFKHWYPASRDWAERHNLLFRQQGYNPPLDVIRAAGAAHIPETEGGNELLLKRVASGAHLYGRSLISAESFVFLPQGGYGLTPQDYKQGIDLLMTAGVNHIIYHGTPYRWDEPGYGETGWSPFISPFGSNISTNISEVDPCWKYQRELNRYAARLQTLLRQGVPDADVLVYLPVFDNPTDARFTPVLQALDTAGCAWEWVNDDLLLNAAWTDAGLVIGDMTFKALILPDVPALPVATAQQIAALAEAGAAIIVYGTPPNQQPGFLDYESNDALVASQISAALSHPQCAHIADPESLAQRVNTLSPGPISYEANSNLRFIRRSLDGGAQLAFIRNTSGQPISFTLRVDSALPVGYWLEPISGNAYQAEIAGGTISGTLPEFGSIALLASPDALFPKTDLAAGNPVAMPQIIDSMALTDWILEVDGDDVPGGAVTVAHNAVGDWSQHNDLKYVSSTGRYMIIVALDNVEKEKRYILDLGEISAAADVIVNGQAAGHAIFAPYQVDVTDQLVAGENSIVVEVTPLLRNRLLGKALSGDPEYRHYVAGPFANRNPFPTGLIGPVTLKVMT